MVVLKSAMAPVVLRRAPPSSRKGMTFSNVPSSAANPSPAQASVRADFAEAGRANYGKPGKAQYKGRTMSRTALLMAKAMAGKTKSGTEARKNAARAARHEAAAASVARLRRIAGGRSSEHVSDYSEE